MAKNASIKSHEPPGNHSQETLSVLLAQASGGNSYQPTEKQVDKLLELREKSMDYISKERTSLLPKDVLKFLTLIAFLIALLVIFIFVILKTPEYTETVLVGIIGFIGGGVGGYGIGSKNSNTDL
jgi:hypothetical protein